MAIRTRLLLLLRAIRCRHLLRHTTIATTSINRTSVEVDHAKSVGISLALAADEIGSRRYTRSVPRSKTPRATI
jgi:hypothetical protein